jgi:histidinol-phosphate aminotransferase
MLKPRDCIAALNPYRSPIVSREGLNLDLNENTGGCSPRVLARLQSMSTIDLARYPERERGEQAVAKFLGLKPEQVLLTNGVDDALLALFATYLGPDDEMLLADPTFVMYSIYGAATGARLVRIRAGEDLTFPTTKLIEKLSPRTRVIAVANPNNPTGIAASRADLLRVVEAAPDAAVLVDEAYFEFHGETLLPDLGRYPNLFIARTFSKAYGLAGLRLGVLAGASGQIGLVRRFCSPFNVNAIALACLEEALADQAFATDYVAQVKQGRERLGALCSELGLTHWPSRANFVLIRVGAKAADFVSVLARDGVQVRDVSANPGCSGCVRITVPVRSQMEELLKAMRETVTEYKH